MAASRTDGVNGIAPPACIGSGTSQSYVDLPCSMVFHRQPWSVRAIVFSTGEAMNKWSGPFRVLGYVVVLLMGVAMLYAAYISIAYWSGISV